MYFLTEERTQLAVDGKISVNFMKRKEDEKIMYDGGIIPVAVVTDRLRMIFQVGNSYSIKRTKNEKSRGRIIITNFQPVSLAILTPQELENSGFRDKIELLILWMLKYDNGIMKCWDETKQCIRWKRKKERKFREVLHDDILRFVAKRPGMYYNAWRLEFKRTDSDA